MPPPKPYLPLQAPVVERDSLLLTQVWRAALGNPNAGLIGGIVGLTGPVTATGPGTVTSTITPTGVVAGSYTNTNLTVNAAGQLTAASNGLAMTLTTTVLTNAQIKALPTTPVSLLAAPGVGFRTVPILIDVHGSMTTGYTNIDPNAFVVVHFETSVGIWSNYLANDSTLGYTFVTDIFGGAHTLGWQFVPYTIAEPVVYWGNLVNPYTTNDANEGLLLQWQNNAAGNLTGGHAANTLTLNTLALVVAI